jgi:phosphohistidine phosphatase SixA
VTDALFLRHGHDGGGADDDRGLSDMGRRQVEALARQLAQRYPAGLGVLFASPARRTRETAEMLAFALGAKFCAVEPWLAIGAPPEPFAFWADSAALAGHATIAYVGHAPDLVRAAAHFTRLLPDVLPSVSAGTGLILTPSSGGWDVLSATGDAIRPWKPDQPSPAAA